MNLIVHKAKQTDRVEDRASLVEVTDFEANVSVSPSERSDLDWAKPFLALPRVQTFYGISSMAMGDDGHNKPTSKSSEGGFGQILESIHFISSCIDDVAIADFLRHNKRLRTFTYSHMTIPHIGPQEWNICKFITAIERQVGSRLEELSVTIQELRGPIAPGKVSMRGFKRLRRLELPLEVVVSYTAETENGSLNDGYELNDEASLISNLIPSSISLLSLNSDGSTKHAKALEEMFRHFASWKESQSPALERIYLFSPYNTDKAYTDLCNKLLVEIEEKGVVLRLREWSGPHSISWEYED